MPLDAGTHDDPHLVHRRRARRRRLRRDRARARDRAGAGHQRGADGRLDEPRGARAHARDGRTWFWSRSRQEYWCKGETSGDRQYVRDGPLRLRHGRAAVRRRAGGPGRVPHRRAQLLLPRRSAAGPRPVTCDGSQRRSARRVRGTSPRWRGSTPSCRCGARCSPIWRRRCRRSRSWSATARASCSSRWSTPSGGAGSRSSAGIRRSRSWSAASTSSGSAVNRPAVFPSTRARSPRSTRCCSDTARPSSTCSRPSTAASSAGSATTPCARSSACPTSPPDDLGLPDAVLFLAGQVAAFDHFRQRVLPHRERVPRAGPPTTRRCAATTTPRSRGSPTRSPTSAAPLPYTPAIPPRRRARQSCPTCARNLTRR